MLRITPPGEGFDLSLRDTGEILTVSRDDAAVVSQRPLEFSAPLYKIAGPGSLQVASIKGKVVELDTARADTPAMARAAAALHPAAFLETDGDEGGSAVPRLIDPDQERISYGGVPRLVVRGPDAVKLLHAAKPGDTGITITIKLRPHCRACDLAQCGRSLARIGSGAAGSLCAAHRPLRSPRPQSGRSGLPRCE